MNNNITNISVDNNPLCNPDTRVLHAAYQAWNAAAGLRRSRNRNKRFTYGQQWIDVTIDARGNAITDWQRYNSDSATPVTNNVLRQLVKTIVGRFRSQFLDAKHARQLKRPLQLAYEANDIQELDSRALEEFLISGCVVQRVEPSLESSTPVVTNVNLNKFFINAINDPMGRDCEIIGQLHDLSLPALMQRLAQGSRRKAAWLRRVYAEQSQALVAQFATSIGADSQSSTSFWTPSSPGKCRAIEIWTLDSHEVLRCTDVHTAQVSVLPYSSPEARQARHNPDLNTQWAIAKQWQCRWFSPTGVLLAQYDSPWQHHSHPFAVKFYPLTDGEVHGFIEDVIDQQKFINRLITLLDHIMASSAKGVLLYPDTALPEGYSWTDVKRIWHSSNGIIPYTPGATDAKPQQISKNNTNIGAFEMINLQTSLLDKISGVNGALQGQCVNTGGSVNLYRAQADNATIALSDIFGTFNAFRSHRDALIQQSQS